MIFFDIDGTLIDHASASAAASVRLYDHFAGEIPFSRDEFPAIWEAALMKHFNRFCRGEISVWEQRRARIRDVFANPELNDDGALARYWIFIKHYEALTRPYADAALALKQLAGKPLGIISNGVREQQIGKLERAGLLHHFSVMVFSEDVGLGKPAPAIFLEACRRAGENPADCIHVGDDITCDIEGGAAAGITPIWLDRAGTASQVNCARISTLGELQSVLNQDLSARPKALTTQDTEEYRGRRAQRMNPLCTSVPSVVNAFYRKD
jgi:putative hydrolase of the HAD superfamily